MRTHLLFCCSSILLLLTGGCTNKTEIHRGDWKAQWIGPERPQEDPESAALENVSWIWADARSNPAVKDTETPVYFRKTVRFDRSDISGAQVSITSDNAYVLYVNGEKVGTNAVWTEVDVHDLKPYINGRREEIFVAVKAMNLPVQHTNRRGPGSSPAGLIARIDIAYSDGSTQVVVTDDSWKCTRDRFDGWVLPELDESGWANAMTLPKQGLSDWEGPDRLANSWYCFRKYIDLGSAPQKAMARIAVDSKYWLWINGQMAVFEGGLKRGPNPKDTYFDEVDLGRYFHEGENTIAVLLWYWGRNSFSHKSSGQPGLIFDLDIDGHPVTSDGTWKVRKHPAYGATGPPHPNYRLAEYNIHYDARNGEEGWLVPAYDDAGWDQATEYGTPQVAPWNALVRRPIPQWFDSGLKQYERTEIIRGTGNVDTVVAYLPHNAHVTPYLKVNAPAGNTIDIRTDNYVGGSEYNIRSEYVTTEGVQEFEALAWINGHAVHYAIPNGVEVLGLQYRETGFDAPVTGAFRCDDDFYNILWDKSLRTLQVCMRDNYFDCPDRERAQWWGDAVIEIGQTFYALDRVSDSLSRKAILELVHWRKDNGVFYSPVPAGSWDLELPGQMLMSVGKYGFWEYFMHTGDTNTMEQVYPYVRDYLKLWQMDDRGLLVHREGGWDWGDWGDHKDRPLLDNCYYTLALQGALAMAQVCGQTHDLPFFESRIQSIKTGFNIHFWTGTEYRSPEYGGETDDRGNGLAVVAGIAGEDKYRAITQLLQRQFHASPYTEKYVLEALFMMGETDIGLQRMKQRFDVMVQGPSSTLYEGWGVGSAGYGGGTINHSWSGGPLILLSEYIAGIDPIKPGYDVFQVMPSPGGLKEIDVAVPSAKGDIRVAIKHEGLQFFLDVHVPPGAACKAGIPLITDVAISRVVLNDEVVWENGEVTDVGTAFAVSSSETHLTVEVDSGDHGLRAQYR